VGGEQLLIIKGSVPGKKNSVIYIRDAVKKS
jgi:Ribosomal protein L3